MAYSASGKSGEYHMLVEFVLDSTTLRYADEDVSIQQSNATGFFYAGRILGGGMLVRDLGTFLEPHETIQNFDVGVDNSDGHAQGLINQHTFANRRVRIWLGEGIRKSQYSEVFTGFVAHPNGISWDEDAATFTVIDQRVRHRKLLPAGRFITDTYPNVEAKGKNQPIPIVYGDWGESAGSGNGSITIPVICTDMTTAQKRFKISAHGIKSLDRVLKNAVALSLSTQVNNICLSDGTFRIATAVSYSGTADTISVNCKGIQTINGTLIEKPMDVMRSIQTAWLGLTATDLNITAYHDAQNTSGTDDELVRRFINTELSSEQLAKELLNESQIDMRFAGGKYSPKYRTLDIDSTRKDFRDFDIMLADETNEKADFAVQKDPSRFYANKVRSTFRYDPINAIYDGSYSRQITAAVASASAVIERQMEFNWYYRTTETELRVDRELATYTTEPVNITFRSGPRALMLNLADQIDVTYNIFDDAPMQIRRIETDLLTMTSRLSGYNLFMLGIGHWTASTAPTWNAASKAERDSQGFWCDANGYASASDSSSLLISKWG